MYMYAYKQSYITVPAPVHGWLNIIQYPYCPPHITKPKESRKIFLFDMPERCERISPCYLLF